MIEYNVRNFVVINRVLQLSKDVIGETINARGANAKLLPDDRLALKRLLPSLLTLCKEAELTTAVIVLTKMLGDLENGTLRDIEEDIRWFDEATSAELQQRRFLFMPTEKAAYYEREKLFGDEVYDKFPSACFDVQEAGNCYAMGRYTACVFHLMRTLEVALKALWNSLNTSASEPRDWGGYLEACDNVLKDKTKLQASNWNNDEHSLRLATRELQQIKKLWRNNTMHAVV